MYVILHIGAHRCATTTFQHYMRANADRLNVDGIGFWGPRRTRSGLFRGILPKPGPRFRKDQQRRAEGRIQLNLARCRRQDLSALLVSDENMIGSVRENLRLSELYCGVGERMARYHAAFGTQATDVMIGIRSLDHYWTSALNYAVARGRQVPSAAAVERLANTTRSWRDVITDVACAAPEARLWVFPFETFAGQPEAKLGAVLPIATPQAHAREHCNGSPNLSALRNQISASQADRLPIEGDTWAPFSSRQASRLRERYADDMHWLWAGADGLARLPASMTKKRAGRHPPKTDITRGRQHDSQIRGMARNC